MTRPTHTIDAGCHARSRECNERRRACPSPTNSHGLLAWHPSSTPANTAGVAPGRYPIPHTLYPVPRRSSRRAITLLEMLLAISLIVMTMATLFLFYTIALDATDRAGKFTVRSQQARVVLQQMAREIRQATTGAADKVNALTGKMYSLTIRTSGLPDPALMYTYGLDEKPPPASCDMRSIDYYLAVDPDSPDEEGNPGVLGLVRREQKQTEQGSDQPRRGRDPPGSPHDGPGGPVHPLPLLRRGDLAGRLGRRGRQQQAPPGRQDRDRLYARRCDAHRPGIDSRTDGVRPAGQRRGADCPSRDATA